MTTTPKEENTKPNTGWKPGMQALAVVLAGVVLSMGLYFVSSTSPAAISITTSEMAEKLGTEQIEQATTQGTALRVVTPSGTYSANYNATALEAVVTDLAERDVWVGTEQESGAKRLLGTSLSPFMPPLWTLPAAVGLMAGGLYFMAKRLEKTDKSLKGQKKELIGEGLQKLTVKPKETFADVVGVDESVEELAEIVQYLKDPSPFEKTGASMPHGILLVGQPGTGKTMMARAMANEANADYFQASGSDFVRFGI